MDKRREKLLEKQKKFIRNEIMKECLIAGRSIQNNSITIEIETEKRLRDAKRLIFGD